MTRKLQTYFDPDTEFEAPLFEGESLKQTFAGLQEALIAEALGQTETLALYGPLKQAANEAAGLAWTTPFPLLVFPTLFTEKVGRAREQADRAHRIKAQTSDLLMEAVV